MTLAVQAPTAPESSETSVTTHPGSLSGGTSAGSARPPDGTTTRRPEDVILDGLAVLGHGFRSNGDEVERACPECFRCKSELALAALLRERDGLLQRSEAAEARAEAAERELAQIAEWHHRAEMGWADVVARVAQLEEALRARAEQPCEHKDTAVCLVDFADAPQFWCASCFARAVLAGGTPPDTADSGDSRAVVAEDTGLSGGSE